MRLRRFVYGLAVSMLCFPSAAWAILIEAGGVRIGGYLLSDDGKQLTMMSDGQKKSYDRSKIKILHDVDRQRLENLSKGNPKAYRDYAEELFHKKDDPKVKDDPEIKYMARRLFLIAARLDSQQYGHSSLLRMSELAKTPAEARKCRAMAFLLDPKADARVLKMDAVKPAPVSKDQEMALKQVLDAVYYYRTGDFKNAKQAANRDGFSQVPGMMDKQAFVQACTNAEGKGVNDDVMRRCLRAELWAVDQLAGGAAGKKGTGETSWSSILEARQVNPVSPLSLEAITEFDPRNCLYRKGVWVAP